MSTDPIGAVFERDDTSLAACAAQIAAQPSSELAAIAAAMERVEALLTTGGPPPEGADAIERIADIAFVLHERDVEASLCDALDAAVRELGSASAARHADVLHVRQAAELLRELSQRVADMIALLQVSPPPAANDTAATETAPQEHEPATPEPLAGEDALDGEIPREGLFGTELLEDDEFARAVAELAASLPMLAEPVEAVVVMLREPADLAAEEPVPALEPSEAIRETKDEPADLAAAESTHAPEPADLTAAEPARATEPDEANPETQDQPAELAADESALVPEPDEAVPETPPQPADLPADHASPAPAPEEAVPETQHQPVEFAADEPALTPEQQPTMGAAPAAIEPPSAEESPIAEAVNEPLACDAAVLVPDAFPGEPNDDANATLLSEGALNETLSGEALLDGADALPPLSGLAGAPPDHTEVNGHAVALSPDIAASHTPSEALPPPEAMADSETTLARDSSPLIASIAEPERPSQEEAISAPEDIAATAAEQPYDQGMPPRITESSQSLLPELALVDPQDDPGDLFEPTEAAAMPTVAATLAETQSASEISLHSVAMRPRAAAAAADPLAAMHALSAEELLALFT